jgi:uncharacterized membrane protein
LDLTNKNTPQKQNNLGMTILYIHLFATFTSVFLGYYLFLFSGKPLQVQKPAVYVLCATLVTAGITGIMLNTYSFSPFHILAVVTITTIPLALWNLGKGQFLKFKKGLLYNFIGLNIAMFGAFEPDRYIGRRLGLPVQVWGGLMIFAVIAGVIIVIQANRNKHFFR